MRMQVMKIILVGFTAQGVRDRRLREGARLEPPQPVEVLAVYSSGEGIQSRPQLAAFEDTVYLLRRST